MKLCSRCILPETFPAIRFDEEGVCHHCRTSPQPERLSAMKEGIKKKFEELLRERAFKGNYDCLMCYSGGKDSTYALSLLRKGYGLRILALTFDNGFIPDQTFRNIRNVVDGLGIDHLLFKPRFDLLRKIFVQAMENDLFPKKTLERASTICTACMGLVKFVALRLAIEKAIPFVTFGWSPGQAPLASSVFKNNAEMIRSMQEAIRGPLAQVVGEELSPYFLQEEHFRDPSRFPYNISPLAFLAYDEERIFQQIQELGWRSPANTDANSTNCLLNSLANIVHKERFGFHPYAFEMAKLVREGHLTRQKALEKIDIPEDPNTVALVKERLCIP